MQRNIVAIFTTLIVTITTGNAEAVQIRGARSCGVWIKDKATLQNSINEAWVVGYLSGLAMGLDKDAILGTDNESISLWIDNYCRANPLKDIGTASTTLFFQLINQKKL